MVENRLKTGGGVDALRELAPREDRLPGQQLGDYRVIELIAEGGMGRVYRAERTDGSFEREVALKISTASSFNKALGERFQLEQAVLAGLNHPNIAQLFDASVTTEGWPYIVMELVGGQQLDTFCQSEDLALQARVRLFIQVVDAVALAHARLIVHRDIKPSNVLVDEHGRPKLLDFGIAKILGQNEADATNVTPLTPQFASPEQLLNEPVTAASDVFQLGLLLFQVLTGTPAIADRDRATAIRDAVAPHPVRLPGNSHASLPPDLIAVIEQCLRPAPEERYRDAAALSDDLRAYLDGFPVTAVGNSTLYRLRKFAARHRVTTAISTAAAIMLIVGSGWYTWQLAKARDAALVAQGESETVLDFMIEMLGSANPNAFGEDFRIVDALDSAADRLEIDFADNPMVRARIHDVIGDTFRSIGREDAAEQQHLARLAVYDQLGSSAAKERVDTLLDLAWLKREKGEYDTAFELGQQAIDGAIAAFGGQDETVAVAKTEQANTYVMFGTVDAAIPLLEQAEQIFSAIANPDLATRRATLAASARLSSLRENYAEAIRTYQRLYELDLEIYGEGHTESLITLGRMSSSMLRAGMNEQAIAGRRKQLEIMRRVLGETHPYTLVTMVTLATSMQSTADNFPEQEALILSAIDGYTSHGEPDHARLITARYTLGSLYRLVGRHAEAVAMHLDNLPGMRSTYGDEAPLTLFSIGELASAMCRNGQAEQAMDYFAQFLAAAPARLGNQHRMTTLFANEHQWCLQSRDAL